MGLAEPAPDAPAAGVELTLDLAAQIAPRLATRIEALAERSPAELSFANLWLFREVHRWRYHDGAWPCVSGLGYDGLPLATPLFDVRHAAESVLDRLLDRYACLAPLCEREAAALRAMGMRLEARRDDADYLYTAEQFRHYPGRILRKKANLMGQLLAAHRVTAEPYGSGLRDQALDIVEGWMREKGKSAGQADDLACRDALETAQTLGLDGFLYHADGQPAGFLLAEELHPGVWVIRFAKGLARFKGIAQYMFHHFASRNDRRVDWLNFEHDLGLANFRQTKLSYQPAALLPKWRLLPQERAGSLARDQFSQDAGSSIR